MSILSAPSAIFQISICGKMSCSSLLINPWLQVIGSEVGETGTLKSTVEDQRNPLVEVEERVATTRNHPLRQQRVGVIHNDYRPT